MQQYLTVAEVAAELVLSEAEVIRLVHADQLAGVYVPSLNVWYIDRAELDKYRTGP